MHCAHAASFTCHLRGASTPSCFREACSLHANAVMLACAWLACTSSSSPCTTNSNPTLPCQHFTHSCCYIFTNHHNSPSITITCVQGAGAAGRDEGGDGSGAGKGGEADAEGGDEGGEDEELEFYDEEDEYARMIAATAQGGSTSEAVLKF